MREDSSAAPANQVVVPHMRRVLSVWDLVFYGIILVQPIAPIPIFGVAQQLSDGHFVTTLLIAMFAMMITAFSYGRMAALYPSAGSAYTFVSRGVNVYLGFLVGWAMILDYLLVPLVNAIWVAVALHERYFPSIPYPVAMFLVVAFMTGLNLRGIKTSARTNKVLLVSMSVVTVLFIFLAIRYLWLTQGAHGLFSTLPFYNPKTFKLRTVWIATSYATLAFIGFEGISTLSEDVANPKRNVLLATVLVCLFTGIFGGLLVYLGQRVWPDWRTLPNIETAFMDVCQRVGGPWLFQGMGITILLASLGGALTGVVGASRLLFGMGRDNVLPRKIFTHIGSKANTPTYTILIIGAIVYGAAIGLQYIGNAYEHSGELLNFGAFFSFMGVNFATFWQFAVVRHSERRRRLVADVALPLFGFVFCTLIWWNLHIVARILGGVWFAVGIIYIGITTRGFRVKPVTIHFDES